MNDDNIKKAVTFLTKNGYVVNPPESVFTGSIYFADKQPTMVDAITEDDDFE